MSINSYLKKRKVLLDEYLKVVLPIKEKPERLHEAMWYSLFNGGKRIRSIIMLAIADIAKVSLDGILNAAAGIEMIHTSTLILDDLPSMDDALLRRGKPALHRVYGEATTILVANILQLEGVSLVLKDLTRCYIDNDSAVECNSRFLSALGKEGIMVGQFLDLTLSNKDIKLRDIEDIHKKKTVSLFEVSARIAAIISK